MTRAAVAQPSLTPPSAPPLAGPEMVVEVQDYRWQLLVTDIASLGLGMATQDGRLMSSTYVLGAPIVHAAHGNGGRALVSVGLRMGLPVLGALAGISLEQAHCRSTAQTEDDCGLAGLILGGAAGIGAAVLIDWFALGKVEKPVTRPALIQAGGIRANPMLGASKSGFSLGLGGTF